MAHPEEATMIDSDEHEIIPAQPKVTEEEDDLGAYLDADLDHTNDGIFSLDDEDEESVHPEQQYQESDKKVSIFRRGETKVIGSVVAGSAGLMTLFFLFMHGFDGSSSKRVTASKLLSPTDQRIAALEQQNAQLAAQLESAAQNRQKSKYLEMAQPKAKETDKKQNVAVRPAVYQPRPSYASYAPMPVRYNPVPQPQPARVAPQRDSVSPTLTAEIAELKAQMKELLAAKATPAPEPVAQVQEEPTTKAQDAAFIQNAMPATPIQGGVEEAALMSGHPPTTIAAGTAAKATLLVPIFGTRSQVVLSLDSDIKDMAGNVTIPAGSKLLGYAQITNSVAQVEVQSAIVNGQAITLPATNAIAVLADNNLPIIAKKIAGGSSGPGMGNTILAGLLTAGSSGIGQLLTPQVSNTVSTINGISSQTINPPSTLSNAGLAAAGGLATGLSSGLRQGLTTNTNATASTPAMGVKAGISLKLVFTSPVEVTSASALPMTDGLSTPEDSNSVDSNPADNPADEVTPDMPPQGIPTIPTLPNQPAG